MQQQVTLDGLIRSVLEQDNQPLGQLEAASLTAAELGDLGDALLTHFVDRCRRSGHSWAEIGQHLGVTRQAAQKRFVTTIGVTVQLDRFTGRARTALERAEDAARSLNHNYCGTEHVLLGLFDVEGALSAGVLLGMGVERTAVEQAVVEIIGRGPQPVTGDVPWTPRARTVIEESVKAAVELGHNYVGTEHLLLGLYRGQKGVADKILRDLGAKPDRAKALVIQALANLGPAGPSR
jgi:hypothetical protein